MKEKYFINARIIDPSQNLDEVGGVIVDEKGKIKSVGKNVKKGNIPTKAEKIDLKGKVLIPGIVDMKVFIGEPGFEYKENFRTLSNAALSGGVTSVVTMPNTDPIIDNVSIVDFLKRRGRDKSKINVISLRSYCRKRINNNGNGIGVHTGVRICDDNVICSVYFIKDLWIGNSSI